MGSAVSSETAAKVDELQRAGKSNAEVFEELKAAGLVGGELLARSPDELAAEYAAGRKTELAPGEWKSADAIIDAVVAQKVDGTLDLGSMGRGADDEPPGLLRMNGIPPLSAVPEKAFGCLMVTKLVLKGNQIAAIDGVEALAALEVLDASENQLRAFPAALPASLVELNLSENGVGEVPDCVGACVRLETLILFKNQLSKVSDEIGKCAALAEFNCFNNKLIKVPKALSECAALNHLNVGGNKIKTLPNTDKWTEMVEIKAHQNGIIMLPSLEKMNKLETLKLDMNRALNSAPELGGADGAIKSLTLWETSNCNLTALPDSLLHAHFLVTLNCSSNKLAELPALELPCLEILNVSSNALKELPVEIGLCSKLKTFFFSGNQIKEIPSEYGALVLSIQRFNCSAQKSGGEAVVFEMTNCLQSIKAACEKHDGRFII